MRALKETIWHHARTAATAENNKSTNNTHKKTSNNTPATDDDVQRFSDLIARIPPTNPAGALEDLSVHLCFICLLHLANEHGLAIKSSEGYDDLMVHHVGAAAGGGAMVE